MQSFIINGLEQELRPDMTVADVVRDLALEGKRIAVERNGDIVPRSLHTQTRIAPGDRLEIVVAVGGG
jgi:sulfur carrier protein